MPGFTLHYLFGVETYGMLSQGILQDTIHAHTAAYCLGLQGPDIFFYYPVSYLRKENIGSVMHEEHAKELFQTMLDYREHLQEEEEKNIITAYLAGFLGHYTLDGLFHPFVYARTDYRTGEKNGNQYYARHFELESCFDILYLEKKKGLKPGQFYQSRTIALSNAEQTAISALVSQVSRKVYQQNYSPRNISHAISCMRIGTSLLHDSTGLKKKFYRWFETHIFGYEWLSPMIQTPHEMDKAKVLNEHKEDWENPWDTSLVSQDSVEDLFGKALSAYHKTLILLEHKMSSIPGSQERLIANIGNRSFHSGLEND